MRKPSFRRAPPAALDSLYRYEDAALVLKVGGTSPKDCTRLTAVCGDQAYEMQVEIDCDDGERWTRHWMQIEVSSYNHNVADGFLSLRPALIAAGTGEVRFMNFRYRAIRQPGWIARPCSSARARFR